MNSQARLRRLAPVLAAAGGLAYALEGAIVARAPQPEHHWHTSGYAVELAFIVALLATIALPPLFPAAASRFARASARAVQLGFAATLVSAVASVAAGGTVLGPAFFLGVLAALVGLAALAVSALRERKAGWWAAPLALAGLVGSMALDNHGGGIVFGAVWIVISIGMREQQASELPATAHV